MSRSPHFFRVILNHIINDGMLELPGNFVMKHGKHLSDHARLKVPTGEVSKMELKICENRAWLHKGWTEFIDKYSIQSGFFLVFKYKGRSRFNVLIFDLSTLEMDYHVSSVRISNRNTQGKKCKEIQDKDEDSEDECSHYKQLKDKEIQKAKQSMIESRGLGISRGRGTKTPRTRERKAGHVASSAIKSAECLKSKNPYFKICISGSYISRKGKVHIPSEHSKRYIKEDKHGENLIILNGSNGKTWPVHYLNSGTKWRRKFMCKGWRKFASDNRLQVGDICIFEMMIQKSNAYKVTIFRA